MCSRGCSTGKVKFLDPFSCTTPCISPCFSSCATSCLPTTCGNTICLNPGCAVEIISCKKKCSSSSSSCSSSSSSSCCDEIDKFANRLREHLFLITQLKKNIFSYVKSSHLYRSNIFHLGIVNKMVKFIIVLYSSNSSISSVESTFGPSFLFIIYLFISRKKDKRKHFLIKSVWVNIWVQVLLEMSIKTKIRL